MSFIYLQSTVIHLLAGGIPPFSYGPDLNKPLPLHRNQKNAMATTSTTSQDLVHHKRAGLILVGIVMAALCLVALLGEFNSDKHTSNIQLIHKIEVPVRWFLTALKMITPIKQ